MIKIIGKGFMAYSLLQYLKLDEEAIIDAESIKKGDIVINATGNYFKNKKAQWILDISSYWEEDLEDENHIYFHPLAGSEKSKKENADGTIFKNCNVICNNKDIIMLKLPFKNICITSIKKHNEILAYTSHFLHWLAFNTVEDNKTLNRLRKSNYIWWKEIFEKNKQNISKVSNHYKEILIINRYNISVADAYRLLIKGIPAIYYGTALNELLNLK